MNKKIILILILVLVGVGIIFWKSGLIKNISKNKSNTTGQNIPTDNKKELNFLIEGFPIDQVPLYKLKKIGSSHIFVNTDPINVSTFGETNYAYYNIVFSSESSQEEFLNYYKNLFESQFEEEFSSPNTVNGIIGQYKVSANHYGSDNTGYLQVFLPSYDDKNLDKYFTSFPKVVEDNQYFVEHEKSYGLLNQNGGEIEFSKYFTVINSGDKNNDGEDDIDEFSSLEEQFKEKYKNKPEYSYDEKTGIMEWKDGEFGATVTISRDHGRIYLVLRKNFDK